MKEKNLLILDDEFIKYCELNKIEDIEKLAKETFKKGFDLLKYGWIPPEITEVKPFTDILKNEYTETKFITKEKQKELIKKEIKEDEKNNLYSE